MGGGWAASLLGCLGFPPPLCRLLALGSFDFPLAPWQFARAAIVGVGGGGCIWFFRPRNWRPCWGGRGGGCSVKGVVVDTSRVVLCGWEGRADG